MESNPRLAERVGALVLLLIALGVVALLSVHRIALAKPAELTVFLGHIAGLKEDAEVMMAGRQIGILRAIELIPGSSSAEDSPPLGGQGGVRLHLDLDPSYLEWTDQRSEVFVASKGLFGERYLEFGPPAVGTEALGPLRDGDSLRGIDPPVLDRTLQRTVENLTLAKIFLADVGPEARALVVALDEMQETLDELEPTPGAYRSLAEHVAVLRAESARLGGLSFGDIDSAYSGLSEGSATLAVRVESIASVLQPLTRESERIAGALPPNLGAKLRRAAATIERTAVVVQLVVANSQALVEAVRSGEGTIGGLMNDPEFTDDAKKLGKILKRRPWEIMDHPGKKARAYERVPNPDRDSSRPR